MTVTSARPSAKPLRRQARAPDQRPALAAGTSRIDLEGLAHPVMRGAAVVSVVPEGAAGVIPALTIGLAAARPRRPGGHRPGAAGGGQPAGQRLVARGHGLGRRGADAGGRVDPAGPGAGHGGHRGLGPAQADALYPGRSAWHPAPARDRGAQLRGPAGHRAHHRIGDRGLRRRPHRSGDLAGHGGPGAGVGVAGALRRPAGRGLERGAGRDLQRLLRPGRPRGRAPDLDPGRRHHRQRRQRGPAPATGQRLEVPGVPSGPVAGGVRRDPTSTSRSSDGKVLVQGLRRGRQGDRLDRQRLDQPGRPPSTWA